MGSSGLLWPTGEPLAQILLTGRSPEALSYPRVHSVLYLHLSKSSHHSKSQLSFCKAGIITPISQCASEEKEGMAHGRDEQGAAPGIG